MPSSSISRRELAVGAAVLAGVTTDDAVATPHDAKVWDTVVVGAGYAGITAARELAAAGRSVIIVEARDRIGGRTHSEQHGDHVVEYGGTWVHWSQPYIWTEIQRYRAALVETPSSTPQRIVIAEASGPREIPLHEAGLALVTGLNRVLREADTVYPRPFDPRFSAAEIHRRSDLSLGHWMAGVELTDLQRTFVSSYFATLGHCHLEDLAYTEALRGWALAGGSYDRFSDALARYRLRDGAQALLAQIARDAKAEMVLSAPVTDVRQAEDGVTVLCASGMRFQGRTALITAPLNTLGKIGFEPPLNAAKQAHAQARHAGQGVKGYATIKQQVGLMQGFAADPAPITNVMTDAAGPWGTRLIFFGPDPSRLDASDPKAVQEALRAFLPDAEVADLISHDWNTDPYALGTWCHFRPDQQTRFFPADRAPEGRLYFASADTADGWRGFIDGAVERGILTARDVLRGLDELAAPALLSA